MISQKLGHRSYQIPFNMVTHLYLVAGCRVMLLKNFDVKKGLCNRSIGTVLAFTNEHLLIQIDKIVIKICRCSETNKSFFYFKQFPVRLAYAITGHKVQSLTLKGPVAVCGIGMSREEYYVCLSRVEKLDQLYLDSIPWKLFDCKGKTSKMANINTFILSQKTQLPPHFPAAPLQLSTLVVLTKPRDILRICILDQKYSHAPCQQMLDGRDFCISKKVFTWQPDIIVLLRPVKQQFVNEIGKLSGRTPLSRLKSRFNILGGEIVRYKINKSSNHCNITTRTERTTDCNIDWNMGYEKCSNCSPISFTWSYNIMKIPNAQSDAVLNVESSFQCDTYTSSDSFFHSNFTIFDVHCIS